jgi:polysaccharide export outer membrane protein
MRGAILCGGLALLLLAGCSWLPRAGPSGSEVEAQAATGDQVSFDIVKVDDAVIKVLRAQGEPGFPERFKKYAPPPEYKIAVGDTISVVIWEAAANGLFGESLAEWSVPSGVASRLFGTPTTGAGTLLSTGESVTAFASDAVTRLLGLQEGPDQTGFAAPGARAAPPGATPAGGGAAGGLATVGAAQGLAAAGSAQGLAGLAGQGLGGAAALENRPQTAPLGVAPGGALPTTLPLNPLTTPTMTSRNVEELLQQATSSGRPGTRLPDQQVGPDGAISIPYAGRVAAAGRSPAEVERTIETRLGPKALEPHALVVVRRSISNSIAVAGDAVKGGRVPLSPGGDRLLQVVAAAGGATSPPHETFVQLSRRGITATVSLATLVEHPDQNIFAEPGDVLTVIRRPQTFSAFGASGKNDAITFDSENLTLAEALAKAGGLLDDRADPRAVFLLRYEPVSLVHALGQPIATAAPDGISPIVYRLDLGDAKSYPLAQEFRVRDKDIIFVANAELAGIYKGFDALSKLTGPIVTGLLTCQTGHC